MIGSGYIRWRQRTGDLPRQDAYDQSAIAPGLSSHNEVCFCRIAIPYHYIGRDSLLVTATRNDG